MIQRQKCILDKDSKLTEVFTFNNFPIKNSCEETISNKEDIFMDMVWGISKSGLVQLINLVEPSLLYSNYHSPGTVGQIWEEHHKNFYKFIDNDNLGKVLEIGGSSGSLLKHFLSHDNLDWTIIEPNLNVDDIDDNRITYINDFFENHDFNSKYDTIIHSHLFEHIYDPICFLNKINEILNIEGNQYISIPNMKFWLENGFTNALNFEHTFYVDDLVLENFLFKTGFKIIGKNINHHSIFLKVSKTNTIEENVNDISYVKEIFTDYIEKILFDVTDISNKIEKDQKLFLFGAHFFSSFILNLGIDENQIISILDNNKNKWNKRLYGTNLSITNPDVLRNLESPQIIVRSGIYTEEIKNKLLNINDSCVFI